MHVALNKKLILDISNQKKTPSIVISVDAINYCNRIMHFFVSLSSRFFGLELEYLLILFQSIQLMKMYLRTAFRILSKFYSGSLDSLFCSAVQGNKVAPALWLIVSIFLVRYL